jgi:murein DD-endopeptidase / murein LD-carboxypeptidase
MIKGFVAIAFAFYFSPSFAQPEEERITVFDPDCLESAFILQQMGLPEDTLMEYKFFEAIYPWLGTPYKYSGNSFQGVDCSGFCDKVLSQVHQRNFDYTSSSYFSLVDPVDKDSLEMGDLIFFKIGTKRISHIGVYLYDNKFAHASTRKGVIVSDLRDPYYKRYFYRAGRLKEEALHQP